MVQPPVSQQPQQPAPNWGNTHSVDCPLTQGRKDLWLEFTHSLDLTGHCHEVLDCGEPNCKCDKQARMNQRDCLWGAVIEYTAGGDEDQGQCECSTHRTTEQIEAIQVYRNEHSHRSSPRTTTPKRI